MQHTTRMTAASKSILAGLQDALAYAQGNTIRGQARTVPWHEAFPPIPEAERPGRMRRAARSKEDVTQ